MTIATFLPLFVLFIMSIFAVFFIIDVIDGWKEDKARDDWKKQLARMDEMKRKEREMFDMQAWEARKRRFAAMGIK